MKTKKSIILWGTLMLTAFAASSQTHVTFEAGDYAAIGVYDTWPESPFRTGKLTGNAAVTTNHLAGDDSNSSGKIVGVQRSRFGSNTFGVKIDLKETFELTPTLRYAHVMINKPVDGRVMLIGLGKRSDRAGQSNDVEQFWSYPVNDVKTGEWFDAVFPIKGNGGIDIYSLVVVPHCEAPHTLSSDFVAYIDDILINDDIKPRVGAGDYPFNFTKETQHGRPSDRWTSSIGMNGTTDGNVTINIPSEPEKKAYYQLFDTPLKVKAGTSVSPKFGYGSNWMHSYVYIDRDNDGDFSSEVNSDFSLNGSSDLVSYSLYSGGTSTGKNSAGQSFSQSNDGFSRPIDPPSLTIPSNLSNGIYRIRYKVDWNSIDPGGDVETFIGNGGIIVDALLNVHGDYCTVTQDNRNGEVVAADGTSLNGYRTPFGQAFKVKMVPSNGFEYNGIRVRHGYNLTGDSLSHGNPQYRDAIIYADEFDAEDCVTIPAELMDGDVLIEGLFVEEGHTDGRVSVTYNVVSNGEIVRTQTIKTTAGSEYPVPEFTAETPSYYYELTGIPEGTCNENTTVELQIVNKLPFEPSADFAHAKWYKMTITAAKNYLTHSSGSYINLSSSTTTVPSDDDANSQWAFIGNVFDGFKIVNLAAGESMILSSSTNTSTNAGGNTYPIMTATPVPDSNNTYWIPSRSDYLTDNNGFYLYQLGHPSNRVNSRDNRLAYWTGGADAGSTLTVTKISGVTVTIENAETNQGTIEVYDGTTKIQSGGKVDENTELTIVVTPADYFFLNEVTVDGNPIEAVDGVYNYTVTDQSIVIAATFERDPDAPIDYCTDLIYAGSGTRTATNDRTDRYITSLTVTDGTSTITVDGAGGGQRDIYKDETSKVLNTQAGKTISLTSTGVMNNMHNFIYADFDRNGFGANDRVMYSDQALGTFTFTIPDDVKPGEYRIRHIVDWENDDPCEFAKGQRAQDMNGESFIDFLINVEGSTLIINIDGHGEVEVWTGGDATTGPEGTRYTNGDVIPASGMSPVVVFKPAENYKLYSLTYDGGDGVVRDCSAMAIDESVANYNGWFITPLLDPNSGDIVITVVFTDDDSSGIGSIYFDPADGPIEYFTLQGIKVKCENLIPGIYIVRQGNQTKKVIIQ